MKTKEQKRKGQFYTPKLFADYAHKMISEQFGEDWREKFVVWDNCCGEKALTKDYYFKELYCSTLEETELENSKNYNPEATSFQYDFLNDDLNKLPEKLLKAFEENKPIIFFINPPYATSSSGKGKEGKRGVSNTMINEQMKADKIGACSQNLYAQFLYRILMIKQKYNLTDIHIALFSPPLFLTGTSYAKFRKVWLKDFSFNNGVLFKASHFADVANNWGISFSIWNCGETADKNNFNYKLIDNIDGEIEAVGEKYVYNTDGKINATNWVKSAQKYNIKKGTPCLTNGINITENKKDRIAENAIGTFINDSNNVNQNTQGVAMFSGESKKGNCSMVSILKDNFTKCTALFSARKLIDCTWVNSKDEYLAPKVSDNVDDKIKVVGEKVIYNADGLKTAKEWIKEPIKDVKVVEKPTMSSGLIIKEGKNSKTKIAENALGCYMNIGNNVYHNATKIALYSSADSSNANGISILPENFDRVMANFAARKLVNGNWINHTDEYLAPKVSDNINGEIEVIGEKIVYNVDNDVKASDWLRTELKEIKDKKVLFPHLSNPLRVVEKENQSILPNSIGGFCSLGNNVNENTQGVVLVSAIQTRGTACITNSVIPQNFKKVTALFSARKLVESCWVNSQDEYLAPNTINDKWNEFVNDSIIFSLFNSHSQQSSLRQVEYKGKKWDIKNEFFWMSKDEIMKLANECSNDECYNDAKAGSERYVYKLLQKITLSPEAQAVLDYAIELTRKTFKYRKLFNENNPKYQINNWDSGFYQLKALWKEYTPDELKTFKELFKKLADKMRPMVYELGFLKK